MAKKPSNAVNPSPARGVAYGMASLALVSGIAWVVLASSGSQTELAGVSVMFAGACGILSSFALNRIIKHREKVTSESARYALFAFSSVAVSVSLLVALTALS
ncbi:hypothetical protein [Hoyosella rhizosphaerae]|uniref:hypothetical protein n=1 Tax=Hoyosella rhizosphaerae TaxID=1755582 RepID=UPI001663AD7A|nr:hypothetical protein [Hoyosella rhizosphaerae]